jgi:hypothetical protein
MTYGLRHSSFHARKAPRTKTIPDMIPEFAPIGPGAAPLVEVEVGELEVPPFVAAVVEDTSDVVDEVG